MSTEFSPAEGNRTYYIPSSHLGVGGFGFVFKGQDSCGHIVAVKKAPSSRKIPRPTLQHEARVMVLLQGHASIPALHGYLRSEPFEYLVMDLLGDDLRVLQSKCKGGVLSLKTVLILADQMLHALEHVHSHSLIHRDVKPDNLLIGLEGRSEQVRLIDFGLTRRFRDPLTLKHASHEESKKIFVGTQSWASIHTHLGCAQSRRDDLESLAFVLAFFLRGKLPWQNLQGGTSRNRAARVLEKKKSWSGTRLFEHYPVEFARFLDSVRALEFEEQPDYAGYRRSFAILFKEMNFEQNGVFEWHEPGFGSAEASAPTPPLPTPVESQVLDQLPVKPGQYVFARIHARRTFEGLTGPLTDPNYWHDPALSSPTWEFLARPALILHVKPWPARRQIVVSLLPLACLSDSALAEVPEALRSLYFPITLGAQSADEECKHGAAATPSPPWPLAHTYHCAPPTPIHVNIDVEHDLVSAFWKLDDTGLSSLVTHIRKAREALREASHSSVNSRVQHSPCTVFAQFSSITPASIMNIDLDADAKAVWSATRGWTDEYALVSRRMAAENDDPWTEDRDESSQDSTDTEEEYVNAMLAIQGWEILPARARESCSFGEEEIVLDAQIPKVDSIIELEEEEKS